MKIIFDSEKQRSEVIGKLVRDECTEDWGIMERVPGSKCTGDCDECWKRAVEHEVKGHPNARAEWAIKALKEAIEGLEPDSSRQS